MSVEVRCPLCKVGILSWHDTNMKNQTDMGNGDPYFMCSNQVKCGLVVSTRTSGDIRGAYKRIMR